MHFTKYIHAALLVLTTFITFSCAPSTSITTAANGIPAGQRVSLDNSVTSEQKDRIREATASKFGGFEEGPWGRSGVIGALIVSVNHEVGSNHYYDGRGTYNTTSTGAFSVSSVPGKVKILAKPDHYQIPKQYENNIEFQAKPGHQYFIGYIVDEKGRNFRWVPVVFDKTEGEFVNLAAIKPETSPRPVNVTIYI